jgi:hypothetical protein
MPFLSFLTILPVLGFVYSICFIAREERAKLSHGIALPATLFLDFPVNHGPFPGKRQIKWISTEEFKTLSRQSDSLILIVLRRDAETAPIPFPESHILYIEPDRLIDLLHWLTPSTGAVLYTSNRLSPTISGIRNLSGSAPIYVLCKTE